MEAYTDFAEVYDELMDDTPYEEWCAFLMEIFRRYGVDDVSKRQENAGTDTNVTNKKIENPSDADGESAEENLRQERNTILDLGCGTGTLTELLARGGYDMIGVDNAEEMLRIAMEKRERSGLDILYLLQDMRELELYGTVGTVVSVCDSLNYLLEEEDIVRTFERVNNYLYPQGIFIFDFNTVYKYAVVIGDATIAENREDCSFIWENYYHEEQEINEYDLTVFVAEGTLFRRFQEVHYQRGYRLEQIKALLTRAGLEFLEALDADTHGRVTKESERIYVVARKGAETAANQVVS
ncbi:MAG: class I SAM-dependent methyltransferase [Lachnospiraceae bacterium]|nr:class I SAM-dependent methyltransferase [Lachnospiraceae bacterium]